MRNKTHQNNLETTFLAKSDAATLAEETAPKSSTTSAAKHVASSVVSVLHKKPFFFVFSDQGVHLVTGFERRALALCMCNHPTPPLTLDVSRVRLRSAGLYLMCGTVAVNPALTVNPSAAALDL